MMQTSKAPLILDETVSVTASTKHSSTLYVDLGSVVVLDPRIICATSAAAYTDAKCLHPFGKFNAFLDMFYRIKSLIYIIYNISMTLKV